MQETLSDERANMLIHTPLSQASEQDNVMDNNVRVIRVDTPKEETLYIGTERNAPCPCGSGKKYKQCHGKNL